MSTTRPQCPNGVTCPMLGAVCAEGRCSRAEAGCFTAAPPAPAAERERWKAVAIEACNRAGDGPDNGCCPTYWEEAREACIASIERAFAATPTSAPPAEPAAAPGVVEALRKLVAAAQAETSDEWDCNSYHPTLRPALRTAEQVLEAALAAASAPRVAVRLTEEQIAGIWKAWPRQAITGTPTAVSFARAVERASWEANGLKEPT